MRMKFNKSGQLLLVSAASLLAATLVTACGTLTVDFVYVTSSRAAGTYNYGEVDVFEVNSESGFMRQIPTSPFPSGGRNPVAEAVSIDHLNLYVVNQDDNTIVQFAIGNDGKIYPQNTTNTPGVYPMAVAVAGSNLFVVDTYQPLPTCSTAAPCSGSIAVFPLGTGSSTSSGTCPASTGNGVLCTPVANGSLNYWPLTASTIPSTDVVVPTAVNVLASGADLFVAAYDSTANVGYVFGFSVAASGALTPLANSPWKTGSNTHPSAVASDAGSKYLYLADSVGGKVLGYSVASGNLTPLSGSPYPAGDQPSAIVVDVNASYVYVTNAVDATVTAYSISSGNLTRIGTYATGLQPVAIGIDPNKSQFLYTVNYLGGNVSGFELSATDGSLVDSQNSPYTANAQPTAVVAIPHNGQ